MPADTQCLEVTVVLDFIQGRAAPERAAALRIHIDSCSECRELCAAVVKAEAPSEQESDPTLPRLGGRALGVGLTRGATLGRYIVLELLGAGGMGAVYSAYDPELDRKIAIKLLRPLEGGSKDDARVRLVREARAMARLSHPNVVIVHDVGALEDQIFIAMELVDGGTIRSWLGQSPSRREILDIFLKAGAGLAAAHDAGLVHRDFKPPNVLLGRDGRVRVADFGLVRSDKAPNTAAAESLRASPTDGSEQETRAGTIMGTPRYMAPEQLDGDRCDARSDQFSFCVSLYEALYNVHPFEGLPEELRASMRAGKIRPLPAISAIPPWVGPALHRGLSPDSANRFPTMDALLAALGHNPASLLSRWDIGAKARWAGLVIIGLLWTASPLVRRVLGLSGPFRAWEVIAFSALFFVSLAVMYGLFREALLATVVNRTLAAGGLIVATAQLALGLGAWLADVPVPPEATFIIGFVVSGMVTLVGTRSLWPATLGYLLAAVALPVLPDQLLVLMACSNLLFVINVAVWLRPRADAERPRTLQSGSQGPEQKFSV